MIDYREDFPIFKDEELVYLDNAATAQRPVQVLEAVSTFYENNNANPFRGVYELSERCTEMYEKARKRVAAFIGTNNPKEIIFTGNTTGSINLLAYSYGMAFIEEGDEVVVSVEEHHSNFLPWKLVCEAKKAKLIKLCPNEEGELTADALLSVISKKTALVALTQCSNVYGRVNDIKALSKAAHSVGAVIAVDGAQSVPHMKVDVKALDCDFLAFSGHKLMAPMGVGVLYGKEALLLKMPPFMQGGEMIEIVHWDRVKYAALPHKFEAGTVNAGGAVGLAAAIDYMEAIGFEYIEETEMRLTDLCLEGMLKIPHVNIIGSRAPKTHKGIISFTVDGVHPHDVATILDADHICVRAGHHCAEPLMDYLGLNSTTRVSFAFYNSGEDVVKFLKSLSLVRRRMGYDE